MDALEVRGIIRHARNGMVHDQGLSLVLGYFIVEDLGRIVAENKRDVTHLSATICVSVQSHRNCS